MYCVSPTVRNIWGYSEHQTETQFLKGMNKALYSTKPPEWDDEIRSTLAQTIGKMIPVKDDVAMKNLKRSYDDESAASTSTENENYDFHKKVKFNN